MSWFGWLDLAALSPFLALALGAFATVLVDAFSRTARANTALPFTALGTVLTAATAVLAAWSEPRIAGGGSLALGPLSVYASLVILGAAAVAVLYSIDAARRMGFEYGEYYALILFSTCGMLYLVAANDLVSLFIAFELMSLAIYALVAVSRHDPKGGEGAMKYFVLGSFSSAFLLMGAALLYGATGTIELSRMAPAAAGGPAASGVALGAIALIMVGFAFKVGAVPFHAWVPDAYQGAPAAVSGFMATAVKAAAFAAFIRILHAMGLFAALSPSHRMAGDALAFLAAATMIVGNLTALAQSNLQRLLAYSGIAHSGYVLVGLAAATQRPDAATGALFYLLAYAAMTIGAFAILTVVRRDGKGLEDVDDLSGLGQERPGLALAMTVFMVSLIGIPPTAGFMGKLWIFRSAVEAGFTSLVVLAVVMSAVSVYYYLRVIVVMYMGEPAPASTSAAGASERAAGAGAEAGTGGVFATAAAAAATILFGVFPSGALEGAGRAVEKLLGK
jgi:NADH-quinone oxidoreductase subunit N